MKWCLVLSTSCSPHFKSLKKNVNSIQAGLLAHFLSSRDRTATYKIRVNHSFGIWNEKGSLWAWPDGSIGAAPMTVLGHLLWAHPHGHISWWLKPAPTPGMSGHKRHLFWSQIFPLELPLLKVSIWIRTAASGTGVLQGVGCLARLLIR